MRTALKYSIVVLSLLLASSAARAQDALPADVRANIDRAAAEVLDATGSPSASMAIVRDGRIVYVHAYGHARLDPNLDAKPEMRYSVGSISKQFTAAAILMLAEDGKLTLDDPVARWLPELTRAKDVTVRQILTMTSGYQDFWPEDYVMPPMLLPTDAQKILAAWAMKPLDFEPGTKWQYSNTNYVVAGVIVEKASGMPLVDFLQKRVFTPLGMSSVTNTDQAALPAADPGGYLRYALGPSRPAPKEGKGWMFAAGELAMTARDLALWDISMINQSVLKPASYAAMQTTMLLKNGVSTGYGLGVSVASAGGRRQISHTGEVSGFTGRNDVYPDERTAIAVLTNLDATGASSQIVTRISTLLFRTSDAETDRAVAQAKAIFEGLQHGRIDRSLLTSNTSAYFTEQALADFASSLGPLGTPDSFEQVGQSLRGGMTFRQFRIAFAKKTLRLTTFTMADGKLEQYQVASAE